jgi:hypothetical protein
MKPAQIRVFDGLRLTSEHLDHLQQSLITAAQDLREVAGLGKVYRGLDVTFADEGTISISPGLAFDLQKSRIVIDDPQTVPVSFASPDKGDSQLYVCAKHETVEEGQVENHFTIVWDSGSILVRPDLPAQRENLLPIAHIVQKPDGSRAVTSLNRASSASAPENPSPNGAASQPPGAGPISSASHSGIETLNSDTAGFNLAASLRAAQQMPSGPAGASQPGNTVFERNVDVGTLTCALRSYLTLSISVSWKEVSQPGAVTTRTVAVTAQGEVCVPRAGPVTHLSLANTQYGGSDGVPISFATALLQDGIARVAMQPLVAAMDAADPIVGILRSVSLLVRVDRSALDAKIRLMGELEQAQGQAPTSADALDQYEISLLWEAKFGWGTTIRESV